METTTGYLIWRLSTKWRTSVDRVVAPLGLTHAQFSLLGALGGLARSGRRPSQRELADDTGMESIYVSKLARALEKAGLVERPADPDDPRAVRLNLTQRGHEVIDQAVEVVNTLQTEQLDPIGGTDSARHNEFRETLLALLGEKPPADRENAPTTPRRLNANDIAIAATATTAAVDRLLAQAGLSTDEWATLRTAAEGMASEPRVSPDIAFAGSSTSGIDVVVHVQQLEGAGLVESAGDRIRTTSKGRELFERISAASERTGDQLFEGLTQSDLEAAKRVLDSVSKRAGKVRVEL